MTEYHTKKQTEKEGPFSAEELRNNKLKPGPAIPDNAGKPIPSRKVVSAESKLKEARSADSKPGNKSSSKSKISLLQYTAFVLLILNAAVYYYKQESPPEVKQVKVSSGPEELKSIPPAPVTESNTATIPERPKAAITDTRSEADSAVKIRNNWTSFIKAVPGEFKRYKRGGIYRLKAIVQNQTAFPLDTVKIAVNYMRRGLTIKTELLTAVNIPGNGEISVPAPDSRGGTAVEVVVKEIRSTKLEFYYHSELPTEGKNDPYFKL